jgi:hypothetical protein
VEPFWKPFTDEELETLQQELDNGPAGVLNMMVSKQKLRRLIVTIRKLKEEKNEKGT